MPELILPVDGGLAPYQIERACAYRPPEQPLTSRIIYSAAHVVEDPLKRGEIDWDGTLAYRRHLWSYGLGVAEAMDTAQRGMGLPWEGARELIRRSLAESAECGGLIACGAGTDQLDDRDHPSRLENIIRAYEEQCEWIERHGGRVILMASRALARIATSPDDYLAVYSRILSQLRKPAILHWLGDMFDPQLAGYWGDRDLDRAMATCAGLIRDHAARLDGIKISLLDAGREIEMRSTLPAGVRMYTGDDFNYGELIRGDGSHHSDALLGIFDAIAPAASAAIQALDRNRPDEFDRILNPTVPLSRHIFEAPTYLYKTGIVFLAYLNGHQEHFRLLGGLESARSIGHLSKLLVLAEQAGVLRDPDLACRRMQPLLAQAGIEAGVR